jgi:hypothetical protein
MNDKIIASLNEEEKSLLIKIFQKISESHDISAEDDSSNKEEEKEISEEEILAEIEYDSIHQYDEILNGGSVLDSPVELVFNVNCAVFEKNNAGEIINHNELFLKTYHVPLANQQEIKDYVEAFFRKFATTVESAAEDVIK